MSSPRPVVAVTAAALALLVTACTLDLPGYDGGTDAAVVEAGTQTVGDQCSAIATEFCSQAISRCAIGGSLTDCISGESALCCTGSVCAGTSKSPASTVDSCKAAIDTVDCNFIANNTLPPACQGVPQKP